MSNRFDEFENIVNRFLMSISKCVEDGDYEEAHAREDELLYIFVSIIGEAYPEVKRITARIEKLGDMDHPRWYA